jgi:membrane protein YqaA with SNARE-associated domain
LADFFRYLFRLAYRSGALGLLAVGALDSSFLVLPFGNDFLLMGLAARHHARVPLYVLAATLGSLAGVWLTARLSRKGGETLDKKVKSKRLQYVEGHIRRHAIWALIVASLMPPPFPFTAFIAAAGVLEVPWRKLLWSAGAGRLLRFAIEGLLAIVYGRWIMSLARSPVLHDFAITMIVLAVIGSAFSVYSWIRR